MSIVEKIKAYKAAAPVSKDTVLRYPLSTADALALADELNLKVAGADVLKGMTKEPDSVEEKISFYSQLHAVAKTFWREVSGLAVDGVEVVRSR